MIVRAGNWEGTQNDGEKCVFFSFLQIVVKHLQSSKMSFLVLVVFPKNYNH